MVNGIKLVFCGCITKTCTIGADSTGATGNFAPVLTQEPGQTLRFAPVPFMAVLWFFKWTLQLYLLNLTKGAKFAGSVWHPMTKMLSASGMAVRRWQKSQRIYVHPRTGLQSIAHRQLRHGTDRWTDRQTDGSRYSKMPPKAGGIITLLTKNVFLASLLYL